MPSGDVSLQLALIIFCPGGIWWLPHPLFPEFVVLLEFNFGFVYFDDRDAPYNVPFFNNLAVN